MLYFSPLGARPSVMIVFRWCPTFTGCFDPKPWHPPVGGSTVMASPLLDGSRLPAQIPLCGALLPGPWCAFLLLTLLTTAGNVTFPFPVARCSCFQWCLARKCSIRSAWSTGVFAYHFLPVLVWIPALRFCCLPSPVTSLPNGIWLPLNLPPQRILVSLVVWSCCRVRSM